MASTGSTRGYFSERIWGDKYLKQKNDETNTRSKGKSQIESDTPEIASVGAFAGGSPENCYTSLRSRFADFLKVVRMRRAF